MINPAFISRQEEAALIGAMVIGYSDLELSFLAACGVAIDYQFAVLDACHSVRSETGRIDIAHALAEEAMENLSLTDEFNHAERQLRFCLKLRSSYAHSHWSDSPNGLLFANVEKSFKRPLKPAQFRLLALDLLREQESFFENTRAWLIYVELTARRIKEKERLMLSKPPKLKLPKLYSPI
jgi:hypothetical protein